MSNAPLSHIASELLRSDPDLIDLVEQFVAGLGARIHLIEESLAAADYEQLRRAAHQLKGSAGGYGYPVLTQVAGRIEKCATEAARVECQAAFDELKQLVARVVVRDATSDV